MAPPFRAEQMGSFLRPQDLLDVRSLIRDNGVSPEEAGLEEVEKKAIADVVKKQRELGFKAVTSGEFVRTRFWGLTWVSWRILYPIHAPGMPKYLLHVLFCRMPEYIGVYSRIRH